MNRFGCNTRRLRLTMRGVAASLFIIAMSAQASPIFAQTSKPGITDSITQSFKSGVNKVTGVFKGPEESRLHPEISLASDARPTARSHIAFARLHEEQRRFGEAETHYRRAMELEPKNPDVHLAMAQYLDRRGEFPAALASYEQAIKLRPDDASLRNHLGLCLARRGQLESALLELQKAIDLQPQAVLYRNNVAIVLVRMGLSEEALRHLLAVHPEPVAYYNVGHALAQDDRREEAARYFHMALQREPGFIAARVWLHSLSQPNQGPQSTAVNHTANAGNSASYSVNARGPIASHPGYAAPVATTQARPIHGSTNHATPGPVEMRPTPPMGSQYGYPGPQRPYH